MRPLFSAFPPSAETLVLIFTPHEPLRLMVTPPAPSVFHTDLARGMFCICLILRSLALTRIAPPSTPSAELELLLRRPDNHVCVFCPDRANPLTSTQFRSHVISFSLSPLFLLLMTPHPFRASRSPLVFSPCRPQPTDVLFDGTPSRTACCFLLGRLWSSTVSLVSPFLTLFSCGRSSAAS